MTKPWLRDPAIVAVLLLAAASAAAQVSVRGQVFLPNGRAVERVVELRIESDDPSRPEEIEFTDSQGRFVIERLANNHWYTMLVRTDEKNWDTTRYRFIAGGQPTITIHLEPLKDAKTTGGSRTVSVTELEVSPESQKAYDRGLEAVKSGDVPEAKKQFQRALKLDARQVPAYNELAVLLMRDRDYAGAEKLLRAAMDKLATEPHVRFNLGSVLLHTDRLPDAIVQFREALKLNPNWVNAEANLGAALLETGNPQDAQPCLERGTRSEGIDQAMAFLYLGKLHAQAGDASAAVAAWDKYLELDPNSPNAQQVRGVVEQLHQRVPPGQAKLEMTDRPCK